MSKIMKIVPLLIFIGVLSLFTFSSEGVAPSGVYAQAGEDTDSRVPFAQFADNLDAGRLFITDETVTIPGSIGSEGEGSAGMVCEFDIPSGKIICRPADPPPCPCPEPEPCNPNLQSCPDPQHAFLFTSFEVEGQDILDDLIDEATRPENVVLETPLPNFLGGSTFIASRAFSGSILDSDGNVIADTSTKFGVFITNDSQRILAMINFAPSLPHFEFINEVEVDFSPAEVGEGTFEAEALVVKTFEDDDEPPSCSPAEASEDSIDIEIQDIDSGLAFIEVTGDKNVREIVEPSFFVGDRQPVVFSATARNESRDARIELRVSDVAGNITECSGEF